MEPRRRYVATRALALALSASLLGAAPAAWAALGQPSSSIAGDGKELAAARRASTAQNGYTVEELVSGSAVVREYVAPGDVVFAVTWRGTSEPSLSSLLGTYAGEYAAQLAQTPHGRGRRSQRVSTDHVVVERWGHMRKLQGRAYVPALVPPRVNVDELQ